MNLGLAPDEGINISQLPAGCAAITNTPPVSGASNSGSGSAPLGSSFWGWRPSPGRSKGPGDPAGTGNGSKSFCSRFLGQSSSPGPVGQEGCSSHREVVLQVSWVGLPSPPAEKGMLGSCGLQRQSVGNGVGLTGKLRPLPLMEEVTGSP